MPLTGTSAKTAFLRNGSGYFAALDHALRSARRTVWIVGWDFNPDTLLRPEESSETLGQLLQSLAEANPDLEVRILIWALGPIYSQKSLRLLLGRNPMRHPRIFLRFDLQHAIRGCHHQKLVCIDDAIAFIGGMDLTSRRWDSSKHRADDDHRQDPDGVPYDPIHDVQAMVSGHAAKLIGDVARRRWAEATDENHEPVGNSRAIWPAGIEPSLVDCPVRLALTEPPSRRQRGVSGGVAMTKKVIAEAKRHLYIETQYLASFGIGQALAARLKEKDGPEIVIVVTHNSHGLIEKIVMGGNRDRLIGQLKLADRYDRLRIYYPVVPSSDGERAVLIHSKLLLADDRLLRIGSSNLNHRSEGLDTECDILFDANRPDQRDAIAALLESLLVEYLGCGTDVVSRSLAQTGSLIRTMENLNKGSQGLREFEVDMTSTATGPILGTALVDPLVRPRD
ncbi:MULTISPECIES: phospholipase D-like domain-containing protein [unclassified Sinorhizobium]|uniref:phospholipase D-like domain-containing protein n=1 Tax=unclassified Sinorhizobium TaxID=2613772 RepID=UPI0035239B54